MNHSEKEFVCGDAHNNTAEPFNSLLERAKQGVSHYISEKHLHRYLPEFGFRWDHRIPEEKVTKKGRKKTVMIPFPVVDMLRALLCHALGRQLRRSINGGIIRITPVTTEIH